MSRISRKGAHRVARFGAMVPLLLALWSGSLPVATAETILQENCRIVLRELQRFGHIDGEAALSRVSWAFVNGAQTEALVVQPQEHQVRAYSLEGAFLRAYGGEGSGPGEFRDPITAGFVRDELWVWDRAEGRLSFFSLEGGFLRSVRLAPGGRVAPLVDGSLVRRDPTPRGEGPFQAHVRRIDARDGSVMDTIRSLRLEGPAFSITSGSITRTAPQPFSDDPLWGVFPSGTGVVFVDRRAAIEGSEATFGLEVWRPSGQQQSVRIPYEPVPLSEARVDRFVEAFSSSAQRTIRVRGLPADPRDFSPARVRQALRIPRWKTPITALVLGADERLWLRREQPGEAVTENWSVVDLQERSVCHVQISSDWELAFVGATLGLALTDGPMGVPQVIVFGTEGG